MYTMIAILFSVSCSIDDQILDETFFHLHLPAGFSYPDIPENNMITQEKIDLGKELFFDERLSIDSTISCASCHKPEFAFSDQVAISEGVDGRKGFRNAPSLANVAYAPIMLRDGGFPTLETQVMVPIQDFNEMAFNMLELSLRLQNDAYYVSRFQEVFGTTPDPSGITKAIASFERSLLSGNSKYDSVMNDISGKTFTASEKNGYDLFMSDALNCSKCHSGFNLTNYSFENNGLYEVYDEDEGRAEITGSPEDIGKFKIPTLRNVEITFPYMHDGSLQTLEDVINMYADGGSDHPNKSRLVKGFSITESEKQDLINFLKTLTDETFITNPEFMNN
ncbi:MAG: cytochrome-c peroxidase [Chitinophagales bacterium]